MHMWICICADMYVHIHPYIRITQTEKRQDGKEAEKRKKGSQEKRKKGPQCTKAGMREKEGQWDKEKNRGM